MPEAKIRTTITTSPRLLEMAYRSSTGSGAGTVGGDTLLLTAGREKMEAQRQSERKAAA
jgi:hypothetical protein